VPVWILFTFLWMNNVAAFRTCALALMLAFICWGAVAAPVYARSLQEQQNEFTPISELPPQEQIPAARLLIAAYSFVGVALFLYLFSVARRLTAVQREMERLEADIKRSARS